MMKRNGYYQSNGDHILFVKRNDTYVVILLIYVDDMIVTGNDMGNIDN